MESISKDAFRDCENLREVHFPKSLYRIGGDAFNGCKKLSSVDLSHCEIGSLLDYTFAGCTSLQEVKLPPTCDRILNGCFSGCTSLRSVEAPGVSLIGKASFKGCSSLTDLHINEEQFGFYNPEDWEGSFEDCKKLKTINTTFYGPIPSRAFFGCSNLEYINWHGWDAIEKDAFVGCTKLKSIYIPKGAKTNKVKGEILGVIKEK